MTPYMPESFPTAILRSAFTSQTLLRLSNQVGRTRKLGISLCHAMLRLSARLIRVAASASGSPIDEEAARRGTSVYLVERRIDMLPKALTEDICSLRSGVERMTFSVLWVRLLTLCSKPRLL